MSTFLLLTVFLYWFSPTQKRDLQATAQAEPAATYRPYRPMYVVVNGKKIEYTQCQPKKIGHPFGPIKDYKLVATLSGGPCSRKMGEW